MTSLTDLGIKVDANRKAINALGEQTAARFDRLEEKFDRLEEKVDNGFAEIHAKLDYEFAEIGGKLDAAAAGQQQILTLLTRLIDQQDE
jgi:hypothetical protein